MMRHPLEEAFNASAWDILSAIERGFRAQVDVKGKLAEYFLYKYLLALKDSGKLDDVQWPDEDGKPDFLIRIGSHALLVECKNIRNEVYRKRPAYKVEIQRTRNSMDGTPTRGYRHDEFHILAACLFNQTHQWKYLYIAAKHLARRTNIPEFLVIMQRVPYQAEGFWRATFEEAMHDALS